jgi:hypothetical protein
MGLPSPPERVGAGAASIPWDGDVIYRELCGARLWRDHYEPLAEFTGRHHLRMEAAALMDDEPTVEVEEPHADTAGEQDHTDPWAYAGEDAAPPESLS